MPRYSSNNGFTLVELMIAVAVVATLVAIALPSYGSFTVRSKVTECIVLSSSTKLAVAEEISAAGHLGAFVEAPPGFEPTRYCDNISIEPGGEIIMATRNTGASASPVLQLTPSLSDSGMLSWSCGLVSGESNHVPSQCRGPALASNLPAASPPPPPSTPPSSGGGGDSAPPPSSGGGDPAPPTAPEPPGDAPPAPPGSPGDAPPAPPSGPTPPADPPAAPPPTTPPPATPPSDPPPATPPPSTPPPASPPGSPPPSGKDFNDYPSGSEMWCALHPNPPKGRCKK